MDITTPPGTKVKFVERNVSDAQVRWGDNADPRDVLMPGNKYTVERVERYPQHAYVYLKEYPGLAFNSVWFK